MSLSLAIILFATATCCQAVRISVAKPSLGVTPPEPKLEFFNVYAPQQPLPVMEDGEPENKLLPSPSPGARTPGVQIENVVQALRYRYPDPTTTPRPNSAAAFFPVPEGTPNAYARPRPLPLPTAAAPVVLLDSNQLGAIDPQTTAQLQNALLTHQQQQSDVVRQQAEVLNQQRQAQAAQLQLQLAQQREQTRLEMLRRRLATIARDMAREALRLRLQGEPVPPELEAQLAAIAQNPPNQMPMNMLMQAQQSLEALAQNAGLQQLPEAQAIHQQLEQLQALSQENPQVIPLIATREDLQNQVAAAQQAALSTLAPLPTPQNLPLPSQQTLVPQILTPTQAQVNHNAVPLLIQVEQQPQQQPQYASIPLEQPLPAPALSAGHAVSRSYHVSGGLVQVSQQTDHSLQ